MFDAAHRGAGAGGGQAARARGRALAHRARAPRGDVAASLRAFMGIPAPGTHVGALGPEEGRVPDRVSRAQIELRYRYDELRGPPAQGVRPHRAASRAGRFARDAGARAADRGRGGRGADRAGIAGPGGARGSRLRADAADLYYTLPEYGLRIAFGPTDFTQVNHAVNRLLVGRALSLLDPKPGERIADFFCGLGNFTLPVAGRGAAVLGVEGSAGLVARAQENARANRLADHCRFAVADIL